MAVAVPEAQEALVEGLRSRIATAAPDHADLVIDTLVEAIQARKQTSVTCRKCGTTNRAEVLDAVAATNAIKLLIEQTEGRPGVAEQEAAEALAVQRTVYTAVDAQHALALLDAGDLEQLRRELTSSL